MTDLQEMVTELTSGRTNRQPYLVHVGGTTETRHHRTYVPALIDQLADCDRPTTDAGFAGYQSAAPLWLEPLDTLAWIDREAARWVRRLGDDDPADTKGCVRRLHGLWASQDDDTKRSIERDVWRWYIQARVISGWDSVAWKPDNTCPPCGVRRSLRVKLAEESAFCCECRETWDSATIGLLADHIRAENADDPDAGDAPLLA